MKAYVLLGMLLFTACASTRGRQVELRRTMLRELVSRGDWDAASSLARDLVLESPDDSVLRVYRGIIYREQGHLAAAVSDLTRALEINEKEPLAHSALAVVQNMQRNHEEALKHHMRANELSEDSPVYLNNLGFGLYMAGKTEEAIATLTKSLRLDPTDTRAHNNLGFAYAKRGDLQLAVYEFERGGSPGQAKNNLGLAYELDGNLTMAKLLYTEALTMEPVLLEAQANLAHVESKLGDPP